MEAVITSRSPRLARDRFPGIPSCPRVPARLSDDELLCLIQHKAGWGLMSTAELAYQVRTMSTAVMRRRLRRLAEAGYVEEHEGGWTTSEAGLERLRGLAHA